MRVNAPAGEQPSDRPNGVIKLQGLRLWPAKSNEEMKNMKLIKFVAISQFIFCFDGGGFLSTAQGATLPVTFYGDAITVKTEEQIGSDQLGWLKIRDLDTLEVQIDVGQ